MKRANQNSGSTIVAVLLIVAALAVFVACALDYTQHLGRLSKRTRDAQTAMEIGDGCLETLFTHWRNIYRVTATNSPYVLSKDDFYTATYHPTTSPTGVSLIPVPTDSVNNSALNLFPDVPPNFTITQYRIQPVDPMLSLDANENAIIPDSKGNYSLEGASDIPPLAYGPGTLQYSIYYLAAVDVQYPGLNNQTVTTKVRRVFEKQFNTPWTWALCFNDDLEINPTAPLTINGMVQANSNLYTATSALTLTDKTSYVGQWNIGWAPGDSAHTSSPASPSYPSNLPPAQGPDYLPYGWDARQLFNSADTNPNNDGYREIIQRPDPNYTDPVSAQRYYNQADVKVLIDGNNTLTIMNGAGTVISSASSNTNDKNTYTTMKGAIATNKSFQDNREGASVRVVDVDVSKLTTAINNKSITPTNSSYGWVFYIADTSATSTTKRGIRLINGQSLPSGGFTFVSDNPVYIKGDFNTGGTPASDGVLGLVPDPTQPTVSKYTATPAAILADAITVQSANWADNASYSSLASRVASNTTINAALVAGIVPSSGGNYSGGAENFVRFMEDWTGKNFTYYGSMVELYSSAQGTGTWGKSNVYNAPNQYWYYDTQFTTQSPPGNLIFAGYLQQQRWYQVY
jgi:hypothetical protein